MTVQLTRREFLAHATALGAALALGAGCSHLPVAKRTERRDLYPQGVASGDPEPDSVILWTRRIPDAGTSAHRLEVEVASDPAFAHIVARGDAEVTAATDWTCRFLAAGLSPDNEYWYRFVDEAGNTSRVGRTLTAPEAGDTRPVRFAFVSCQDVTQGACNAYRRMIHEDRKRPRAEQLGFVLHLGDFIYEVVWYPEDSPNGHKRARRLREVVRYPNGEKMHDFHVPTDLDDYRTAYRSYLLDPDLQDARANWPFVPVWDNHEFSWQGYQSQQYFDGKPRPAQRIKLAASQAWYEYQPARIIKPGAGDRFEAPKVDNVALTAFDARGVSHEPNNLTAIHAVQIQRAFRFGANAELIITDNRSYMSAPAEGGDPFGAKEVPWMGDETASEILDRASEYAGGHPPAKIPFGGQQFDNVQAKMPPQSYLGLEQMAWLKQRLRTSRAPWKIWGHSFGTLAARVDLQNLPAPLRKLWPGDGYAVTSGGYGVEHDEVFDTIRKEGITGLAIVAGDKHSFWAGYPCKTPQAFDPVGVEFITGSISAPGLAEVAETVIPKDHPLRALYIHDDANGAMRSTIGMTTKHGVKTSLALAQTGDLAHARSLSNPDVSPNIEFMDMAGHGYTTVRASADELETEFVCIQRPLERNDAEDGGPLVYRAIHRVKLWQSGERPQLHLEIAEGDAPLGV